MNLGLEGLVAVVTGGGSGIGQACADAFSAAGCRVAILDLNPGESTDDRLCLVADVADSSSVEAAVAAAAERFGGIDIPVNSAGIGAVGSVADNGDDEWRRVLEVNLLGVVRASRAALPF